MLHYDALAPALLRWFVTLPLSFHTVTICLTFVVSSAIAIWDSVRIYTSAKATGDTSTSSNR
jgi:hypothetical protein